MDDEVTNLPGLLITVWYSKELRIVAVVVAFIIWIAGMVYCERVADERNYNEWVARAVSVLLPVVGPLIYLVLRNREKLRHRWKSWRSAQRPRQVK